MTEEWILPLYKIYSDDEDIQLITKIIKRGNNWAIGPEIMELEKQLSDFLGVRYCCVLNSGTSALHATLLAYKIGFKDEVIVPSFSFIATANSVLFVGANPIFSDIEEQTFGLDPKSVKEKISANTKAIMPMDYGGLSCDIFSLKEISKENNIFLIEDAAESLGSTIKGKKVGTVSDAAIFSFCGNKVITTGEGGAVVTNSEEIFKKISLIRSHGRIDSKSYFNNPNTSIYESLGYNWRMSSITAALGISQLHKLNKIIKMRQNNANFLSSRLSTIGKIKITTVPENYSHIYQMYTIQLDSKETRDKLQEFLLNKKIFSKVYFSPIHLTKFYQNKLKPKKYYLPKTESIAEKVLTLPLYPNMTLEEMNYLIDSVTEFFENNYK